VTLLHAWLLFGIPALALGAAMFVGRSPWRSLVGYLALGIGFATMTVFDRASGAVFGALLALVYAAGRGGIGDTGPDPLAQTSHPAVALEEAVAES
jgi:mannose/fructose/N-acetylgalactosamine-specific phosphotransferase system component IIC